MNDLEKIQTEDLPEMRAEDFAEMDRWDEHQILATFRGDVVKRMFYRIPGRSGEGISYVGTKELATRLARDGAAILDIDQTPDVECRMLPLDDKNRVEIAQRECGGREAFEALSPEERRARMDALPAEWPFYIGRAHCVDKKTGRGAWGTSMEDAKKPFAFIQANSKAQRNAIRTCLPEASILAFIEQCKGDMGQDSKLAKLKIAAKTIPGGKRTGKLDQGRVAREAMKRAEQNGKTIPTPQDKEYAIEIWKLAGEVQAVETERRALLSEILAAATDGRVTLWDGNVSSLSEAERVAIREAITGEGAPEEEGSEK